MLISHIYIYVADKKETINTGIVKFNYKINKELSTIK